MRTATYTVSLTDPSPLRESVPTSLMHNATTEVERRNEGAQAVRSRGACSRYLLSGVEFRSADTTSRIAWVVALESFSSAMRSS